MSHCVGAPRRFNILGGSEFRLRKFCAFGFEFARRKARTMHADRLWQMVK